MKFVQRSWFATIPLTQRVAKSAVAFVSSSMLSSSAAASAGIMTLSSRFPLAAHQVTVVSLPMTRAQTCMRLSHITGFTLPGMMELPVDIDEDFNLITRTAGQGTQVPEDVAPDVSLMNESTETQIRRDAARRRVHQPVGGLGDLDHILGNSDVPQVVVHFSALRHVQAVTCNGTNRNPQCQRDGSQDRTKEGDRSDQ